MGVKNGAKLFLQLESTDKNLSGALLKVKIEHSYEAAVISKFGRNSPFGSPKRDLEKESQKTNPRPKK